MNKQPNLAITRRLSDEELKKICDKATDQVYAACFNKANNEKWRKILHGK